MDSSTFYGQRLLGLLSSIAVILGLPAVLAALIFGSFGSTSSANVLGSGGMTRGGIGVGLWQPWGAMPRQVLPAIQQRDEGADSQDGVQPHLLPPLRGAYTRSDGHCYDRAGGKVMRPPLLGARPDGSFP